MVRLREEDFTKAREKMVKDLVREGVLRSEQCIRAMLTVKRHLFVWEGYEKYAYYDQPLPLGNTGQTISAPHMCAYMIESLDLKSGDQVLEVGAGSGYHAALVAECVAPSDGDRKRWGRVITIERIEKLYHFAQRSLKKAGYSDRVFCYLGDGSLGYPPGEEKELYDKILVTAAAPEAPPPLLKQLKRGGIMVIPVGGRFQQRLDRIIKGMDGKIKREGLTYCVFVPLLGTYGWR